MNHVLVAVNGTAESASALRWAIDHGIRNQLDIVVVTACELPATMADPPAPYIDCRDASEQAARQAAQRVIDDVNEGASVTHIVTPGPIACVLEDLSESAALIVIGSRSHRGWRSTLRSSLAARLSGRVACPVVSVPHKLLRPSTTARPGRRAQPVGVNA